MKSIPKLPHRDEVENPQNKEDRAIKYVTFFGDSSVSEDSQVYKDVYASAKLLAEHGYGVVNGGGPGVMKAATDGAESIDGDTVAVYWEPKLASIFEGKNLSNHTDRSEAYSNYMMRTLGLIEEGQVYVVCQGGTGTISEFGMVWALAKLYYGKHKPVILFGNFWKDLIESIQQAMLIDDNELAVLHYAETKEEVLELVQSFELEVESRARKTYQGDETPFVLSPRFDENLRKHVQEAKAKHKYKVSNYLTRTQLEEFKQLVLPPARVLDVGCGAGHDLRFLSENYSVTGLETHPELIQIAQFENPNADIINMDIRHYEVQENTFKGIWSRDMLHHLKSDELETVFAKLAKGLVTGGVMTIIVREGDGEDYETDVEAGVQVTKFYNYFREEQLYQLAEKNSLEVAKIDHTERSHKWLAATFRKV